MSSSSMMSASSTTGHAAAGRKQQLPSFILFVSVILFVNLCPFHEDFHHDQKQQQQQQQQQQAELSIRDQNGGARGSHQSLGYLTFSEDCVRFVRLMFTNPLRLGKRATRFTQADAAMLGKMAKVWYIKKKIKKLGKKLKKHTIAVPVFTAIPIYEHSYYPQHPHVSHHLSHGGHHAAASSYAPTFVAASSGHPATQSALQSLATSASNTHQQALRVPSIGQQHQHQHQHQHQNHHHHHSAHNMFHTHAQPQYAASANQIINSYAPSPPLFVDESGGLYGHYGNAYGRYDGGYQLW